MSFFQSHGQGCNWLFWRADSNQIQLFLTASSAPRHVFWSVPESNAYYVLGNAIYRSRIDRIPAQPERVADLPSSFGAVQALWRERSTGRLRVATMQAVAESAIVTTKRGVRYRLADGSTIAALADPAWGLPFIASVLQLGDDRTSWQLIARRATKDQAGDTPGLSVTDDLRHEDGVSNQRLLESYTCSAGICRNAVAAALARRASQAAKRALDPDEVSIFPGDGKQPALLFGTVMGDEVHITGPVLFVPAGEKAIVALPTEGRRQLGLGFAKSLVLLADEYTGATPIVIEWGQARSDSVPRGLARLGYRRESVHERVAERRVPSRKAPFNERSACLLSLQRICRSACSSGCRAARRGRCPHRSLSN